MDATPSRTAMLAAVARGQHRRTERRPWILDDPYAMPLVGSAWNELSERLSSLFPPRLLRKANAGVALRSRFAEDRLEDRDFRQYVVLGAGLDSFSWRRPGRAGQLRVFEVDHPASQAWKRQRVTALGLPSSRTSRNHVFVPVDFEAMTLRDALGVADFEWDQPTLFAWTGVTTYLAVDAISATLRAIASCAPGSEVVFSYVLPSDLLDEDDQETQEILAPLTASSGEPLRSAFSPTDVETLVVGCGLHTADHPDHDELIRRYFADRADDLRPWGITRLIAAAVR